VPEQGNFMEFLEEQIIKVTEDVWKRVMGLEIKVADEDVGSAEKELIASFIQIMGSWDGTVILDCDKEFSRLLASLIFNMPKEEVSDEEIWDALGELVNIIAGNLKAHLPQPCYISLPATVGGWDYMLRFPGSHEVSQVDFECGFQFFGVTLLKQGESAPFTKVVKHS
jgi:chemotaxis protein CheX